MPSLAITLTLKLMMIASSSLCRTYIARFVHERMTKPLELLFELHCGYTFILLLAIPHDMNHSSLLSANVFLY